MGFASGTKIGPYEIQSPLGAGGMGEVYRARDSRLGREVAIKVLPEALAKDADRLRRFETEARAIAALNHPNILSIHDIGTHDGAPYLVSECLEGQTLRQELSGGAIPLRRAVQYGTDIAQGLAAAHDKGIVHRDLKPENVFITHDGRVKILDFGLAKLARPADEGATIDAEPTSAGVVLGTVGYMSPEQVKGEAADARSDIFALGAILYEMLSGQRAFRRDTSAETMTAILKEDPPELTQTGKPIPPAMDRIVRRCLEKKPLQRFQSARDLAFNLEGMSGASSSAAGTAAVAVPARKSKRWIPRTAAGACVLLLVASASWMLGRRAGETTPPTYHQLTFDRGLVYAARFATDGRTIYYSASWKGQPVQIYSTLPDSPESRPLNLVNSTVFAVSPSELAISVGCTDRYIGNCVGTLGELPVAGGSPRELAADVLSADWTANSSEMAVIHRGQGKYDVQFPRGKTVYESDHPLGNLRISPDEKKVGFTEFVGLDGDGGAVVVIDRHGKEVLRASGYNSLEGLAWVGDEIWIAATVTEGWADTIFALSPNGKRRAVLRLPGMLRLHDVSPDGRLLLSKESWQSQILFRGPNQTTDRDLSWLDYATLADLSEDGSEIIFDDWGEAARLSDLGYLRKTDGSPATKLGAWTPQSLSADKKFVVASGGQIIDANAQVAVLPTGVGESRQVNVGHVQAWFSNVVGFMPDDRTVYFGGDDGHGWRVYAEVPGGPPRAITPVVSIWTSHAESHALMPDGSAVFARDLSARGAIYPIAGGEPRLIPGWQADDIWIRWSADGRAAYVYQDEKTSATVFRLDVTSGNREKVATLAPGDPAGVTSLHRVRMTADGKIFAYSYFREQSDLFLVEGVR